MYPDLRTTLELPSEGKDLDYDMKKVYSFISSPSESDLHLEVFEHRDALGFAFGKGKGQSIYNPS